MSRKAREVREIAGATQEAAISFALVNSALDETSAALKAAMGHMTDLERENDRLRGVIRELVK